jgi:group I intron endonuclease
MDDEEMGPIEETALIVTGHIYMVTSPVGKSYIGQTKRSVEQRWEEHIQCSTRATARCRLLEEAIREYGAESFTRQILSTVDANLLDHYEDLFIKAYNTLAPYGYNLREGGDGACTEQMKAQMREGNLKKLDNKLWKYPHHPRVLHVNWYTEINKYGTYLEGYCVDSHPNGRNRKFAKSTWSIDERYQKAVEYKEMLDKCTVYYDEREKKPKGMSAYKNGWRIRFRGHPSKHFNGPDKHQNKIDAYDYLLTICPADMYDEVFKDCVIPY